MNKVLRGVVLIILLGLLGFVLLIGGPSPLCLFPRTGASPIGLSARKILSGGKDRCYHLFLPVSHDGKTPAPLIISLHGFASKPEGQALITRWNELAGEQGYLVAYPQGSSFPLRWNSFQDGPPDDIQFLRDVISDISALAALDETRVFVVGMSNGGALANRAACQMAEQIAAIGIVAGPNVDPAEGCRPSRPVPIIAFYGMDDPVVSFTGGSVPIRVEGAGEVQLKEAYYPGAEAWAAAWAQRNGCLIDEVLFNPADDTRGVRYGKCTDEAEVILYSIQEGGHTWPGGPSLPYLGRTSHEIDASQMILEFFSGIVLNHTP